MNADDIMNHPIISQIDKFLLKKMETIFDSKNQLKQRGYDLTEFEYGFASGQLNLISEIKSHILLKIKI